MLQISQKFIANYIGRSYELINNIHLKLRTIERIISCVKKDNSFRIFLDKELFFIGYEKNLKEKVARFRRKQNRI